MKVTRLNYLESTQDIFYKVIYPIYAREFLFGDNYEVFASLVAERFILNTVQWVKILEHWEDKESILGITE